MDDFDEMDEILQEFMAETREALDGVENDLVRLEENPDDLETVRSIFRAFHTIKGSCGFLDLTRMQTVAHTGEHLLSRLRDGEIGMNLEIANTLLALVDAVREMLEEVASSGTDGEKEYTELLATLNRLREGPSDKGATAAAAETPVEAKPAKKKTTTRAKTTPKKTPAKTAAAKKPAPATPAPATPAPATPASATPASATPASATPASTTPASTTPAVADPGAPTPAVEPSTPAATETADDDAEDDELPLLGDVLTHEYGVDQREVAEAVSAQKRGDPRQLGEILVEKGAVEPETVDEALDTQAHEPGVGRSVADTTIRVDVNLLDMLMNQVGELVLTRNRIQQLTDGDQETALGIAAQSLNIITTELQQEVMKTRMQPINNVWNKFPRVVRDLARESGKKVRLVMEGKNTELDRGLVEAIKDPLTHIIRNAVDHGIEDPIEREANGKPEEGVLSLRAYHEGGHVMIEVQDDGAGIDIARIREKAVSSGLVNEEDALRVTQRDLSRLLFLPGFSTARKVTNISGRGVGMDVVKTNVERIGGIVELDSAPGKGTQIHIQLPLTLAIVPAMTVVCGEHLFAIPQASVAELIRADREGIAIEYLHGAAVYRLRGNLLPLADMNDVLELGQPRETEIGHRQIVVIRNERRQFGLIVDEVMDAQEIVVKPLSKLLNGIPAFAGCTIMGDGRVVLIVDVLGLAQRAQLVATSGTQSMPELGDLRDDSIITELVHDRWLVVETIDDGRLAMPITNVVRLEEFPRGQIEHAGGQMMVQYRGSIMPVHAIADLLEERRTERRSDTPDADTPASVIVVGKGTEQAGLLVERIIDIVSEQVELTGPSTRSGIKGTATIKGRVTEVVDYEHLSAVMGQ